MPLQEIVAPWDQQPQEAVGINWGNPIASGLEFVVDTTNTQNQRVGTKIFPYGSMLVCGFGGTDGVSSTDVLYAGPARLTSSRSTTLVILTQRGSGGGTTGRIVIQGDSNSGLLAYTAADVSAISLWSSGLAVWKLFTPNPGRQYTVVHTFDSSAGASAPPGAWVDGVAITPTNTLASSGTFNPSTSDWWIGNRNASTPDRNWDGTIELAVRWSRVLTNDEIASISANPWQLFKRREWVPMAAASGGGVTVSISGLGASAQAGSLSTSLGVAISCAAASLEPGSVGVSNSVAASGVSATGQAGNLAAALSAALSGLQATGGIGTVTAQIAGNVTVSISGVSATVQAGTVVPALAISVTGLGSTSAVGSVTRSQSVGITGIQFTAQAGTVTTTGGVAQVKSKGLRKTRYTPGRVPSDAKELARFIQNELERLTDALESPFTHQLLEVLHAEPSRKSGDAAMVAYADGTNWNPGAGRGLYLYDPQSAAWTKL